MPLEYRVDLLQRVLAGLCRSLEGARAAVVVSTEGLVVAAYPPGDESFVDELVANSSQPGGVASSSQVAAMTAIIVSLAERTLARLNLSDGEIDRVLIEGSRGSLIVLPVDSDVAIAVLLEKEAKAGVALHVVPNAAQQVRRILARQAA
jgi:predicted regulator of Ras-like GTPase activity (Roadblock/LC7/MglB family)